MKLAPEKMTVSFECDGLDARTLIEVFELITEDYPEDQCTNPNVADWIKCVGFLVDRLIDLDPIHVDDARRDWEYLKGFREHRRDWMPDGRKNGHE